MRVNPEVWFCLAEMARQAPKAEKLNIITAAKSYWGASAVIQCRVPT